MAKWLLLLLSSSLLFGDQWNTIYLTSFPRSGNHWVRFLVEEATHIATSSIYRDRNFTHLPDMFPWGGFCTDHGYTHQCRYPTIEDPILLKTHYPFHPKKIDLESKRAICLIRHPIDAFSSFYIFKGGIPGTRIGKKKVKELIARWKGFYEFWLNQPNVLFIRYEDLHANTPFYLRSILETAGFSFHEQDIERAVMKYPPQGMVLKHIHSYQPEDIAMIKEQLSEFLIRFGYEI